MIDNLHNLKISWSLQHGIRIEVEECTTSSMEVPAQYDNKSIDLRREDLPGLGSMVSSINSPIPIKIRGTPRLGSITTPVRSKKKKLAVPFLERAQLQQTQEMLGWLIDKDLVGSVLDAEYLIKTTDLNLEINILRDSFQNVNVQLLSKYCVKKAFFALEQAISEKKQKYIKTCRTCGQVITNVLLEWMLCSSCLFFFHSKCVKKYRKKTTKVWFCSAATQRYYV
ncbi:PREDICTED: uncharacterized protein LOC108357265 [Rhagoletis zephyria]|uniref:uncharacterized protein LOC108357265 n=1 Tax=Rhagoletis zephyria TaxID=28612 RepID=UPI0008117CFE|nr:PREDICTED: uncharacterized protein LOC108357265 [Rhagoletis zephyria]